MTSSSRSVGSSWTLVAPSSWSHSRTARDASSAASEMLIDRATVPRSTAPVRSASPAAMAWRSARSTKPRASSAREACSWAACTRARPERGQPGAQEAPEQVVVAEPVGALVEGDDEQVGGDEVVEDRAGVLDPGHRRAELGVEGVEHGGRDEEVEEVRREAGDDLAQEEVGDGPVGAGEGREELLVGAAALQRDRGELDARRPTLRELVQVAELIGVEDDVVHGEERGELGRARSAGRRRGPRRAGRADGAGRATTAGRSGCRRRTGSAREGRRRTRSASWGRERRGGGRR